MTVKKSRTVVAGTEPLLGDEAIDVVTGFVGVVVARTEYLNGCVQFCLQPGIKKNGAVPDARWFDWETVGVSKSQVVKVARDPRGGPSHPSHVPPARR